MSSFQSPSLHCAGAEKDKGIITAASAKSTAAAVLASVSCFAMPYAPSMAKLKLFSLPAYEPRCADNRDDDRRRRLLPEKKTQKAQSTHY